MTLRERRPFLVFVLLSSLTTWQVQAFSFVKRIPIRRSSLPHRSHPPEDENVDTHHHAADAAAVTTRKSSSLTDWVVENLESDESSSSSLITQSSRIQVGENDTLPEGGLVIGPFCILAAGQEEYAAPTKPGKGDQRMPIRLFMGRNGWGSGVHPTTRLCLEWIVQQQAALEGQVMLDYGCGSGILSIAALHMGATKCVGVDVEAEALVTAERNVALNDYGSQGRFEGWHVREVLPYGIAPTRGGVNVCVANILIGQLVRPSMVAAIVSNIADGGLLCLSGIRPAEVDALKAAYDEYMEWMDAQYAELSAEKTEGSIESYGFDCGTWARLVGRKRSSDSQSDIERMSELAVS